MTLDEQMAEVERRKMERSLRRENGFEFKGDEADSLRFGLYNAARGGGHSPGVSNIVADHGVRRTGTVEGPRPEGQQGPNMPVQVSGPVLSPAAAKQPMFQDPASLDPIGLRKRSVGEEVAVNNQGLTNALSAMERTQRLRDVAGQAMTDEEQYRRRTRLTDGAENRFAQSENRDLRRDLGALEVAAARATQPAKPELEITPIEGGGNAVTYGNHLQLTPGESQGVQGQPQFDSVTGRLLGHTIDGKFVRYEHPRNPYPDYAPEFKEWEESNPYPTQEQYEGKGGAGGGAAGGAQSSGPVEGQKYRDKKTGKMMVYRNGQMVPAE